MTRAAAGCTLGAVLPALDRVVALLRAAGRSDDLAAARQASQRATDALAFLFELRRRDDVTGQLRAEVETALAAFTHGDDAPATGARAPSTRREKRTGEVFLGRRGADGKLRRGLSNHGAGWNHEDAISTLADLAAHFDQHARAGGTDDDERAALVLRTMADALRGSGDASKLVAGMASDVRSALKSRIDAPGMQVFASPSSAHAEWELVARFVRADLLTTSPREIGTLAGRLVDKFVAIVRQRCRRIGALMPSDFDRSVAIDDVRETLHRVERVDEREVWRVTCAIARAVGIDTDIDRAFGSAKKTERRKRSASRGPDKK